MKMLPDKIKWRDESTPSALHILYRHLLQKYKKRGLGYYLLQ
jgi:hypothetical protein